ncbi:cupin domain-containing protein [Pendulispora albinea]|uniref:Cupin domain-containing protein n=1 Tax=Pendulispora albinea TaxID=2741071 RepID=A0ABZ2LKP6_9BACT
MIQLDRILSEDALASGGVDLYIGIPGVPIPPIAHIGRDSTHATMRWCVERMMTELRDPQPGALLVAQQVAYTMLVQVLRLYLANHSGGVGWLAGRTIRELAAQAGMSRSRGPRRRRRVSSGPSIASPRAQ